MATRLYLSHEADVRSAFDIVRRAASSRAVLFLLAFDGVLIGLHILSVLYSSRFNGPGPAWFRLDIEMGVAEVTEYALPSATCVVLLLRCLKDRRLVFAAPGAAAAYLACDNAFVIHEFMGNTLLPRRARWGELIYMCTIGALILLALFAAFVRARSTERTALIALGIAMAALGAMAIVGDALHTGVSRVLPSLNEPLTILEDGGELLSVTLLFAVALHILIRKTPGRAPALAGAG